MRFWSAKSSIIKFPLSVKNIYDAGRNIFTLISALSIYVQYQVNFSLCLETKLSECCQYACLVEIVIIISLPILILFSLIH